MLILKDLFNIPTRQSLHCMFKNRVCSLKMQHTEYRRDLYDKLKKISPLRFAPVEMTLRGASLRSRLRRVAPVEMSLFRHLERSREISSPATVTQSSAALSENAIDNQA